jgi:DNA-binding HxlR family transcriptional regulator
MTAYGQFCPLAKAAEIIGERWTLLVLRELHCGGHRYGEIRRGIPLISPALLSQRLNALVDAGVVDRRHAERGRHWEYHLTQAGRELGPLLELAGSWGHRWVRSRLEADELDAGVLMWDMRRRIRPEYLPKTRAVIYFNYPDAARGMREWWIIADNGDVDLCLQDPGYEPDLRVIADLRTMTAVWLGEEPLFTAVKRDAIKLYGSTQFSRNMRAWLGLATPR